MDFLAGLGGLSFKRIRAIKWFGRETKYSIGYLPNNYAVRTARGIYRASCLAADLCLAIVCSALVNHYTTFEGWKVGLAVFALGVFCLIFPPEMWIWYWRWHRFVISRMAIAILIAIPVAILAEELAPTMGVRYFIGFVVGGYALMRLLEWRKLKASDRATSIAQ